MKKFFLISDRKDNIKRHYLFYNEFFSTFFYVLLCLKNAQVMKKSSIYTRGGDKGLTGLADGTRVSKDDVRLEAYGTIDELSAHLGLLVSMIDDAESSLFIGKIQNLLFSIAGYLATPEQEGQRVKCWITDEHVCMLEEAIDTMDATLEPLHTFVINGGCPEAAQAHVCRTVCRRAERRIVSLAETTFVDPILLRFVNRMSDYLFVFARWKNKKTLTPEIFWQKD